MLIKFAKRSGKGFHWINPDCISSAEEGVKQEDGSKYTVLHMTSSSEPKIFLKESIAELNSIFRKYGKKVFIAKFEEQ